MPFFSPKNEWPTIFIAIIPASLMTILIFMDQQITAVIANRKELKLKVFFCSNQINQILRFYLIDNLIIFKKSHGYHLDLLIICLIIAICSILGLPWFVAGTVLTLTHINSLKVMSDNTAPGERPVFTGLRQLFIFNYLKYKFQPGFV